LEINPDERTAVVEPGVILARFNAEAKKFGLQFGPDPASAERATMGGSLANNASGAHSIWYGMAADHLIAAETIFADGRATWLGAISLDEARRRAEAMDGCDADLYAAGLDIRENSAGLIRSRWPSVWRRASGYNLNYLLPWSSTAPPGWQGAYPGGEPDRINLAKLMVGSEGTLGIIRQAKVGLVPIPKYTLLGVIGFESIAAACDATPGILELQPSAVELIPAELARLARAIPAFAVQAAMLTEVPDQNGNAAEALLVVEFSGDEMDGLRDRLERLRRLESNRTISILVADHPTMQRQIWEVRKVGLGILLSRRGDAKPWSFIEDLAVPVGRLGEFIREIERILQEHHTRAEIYAHASAGCLHIRPILNLKSVGGVQAMRAIAEQAVALTIRMGGAVSGEHGDGLARSEWLERMFGNEIVELFRQVKTAADPDNLLNPGKIINPVGGNPIGRMDVDLRLGADYTTTEWKTRIDFGLQGGLAGAVELCNGAGVCRKADGVMCPSFQASGEEMHSTRGRANLLRAMLSGRLKTAGLNDETVYEALDLCLACKGCKAECPSGVDMAKLKYEFLSHYYQDHPRRWRDYLFGRIDRWLALGQPFAPVVNRLMGSRMVQRGMDQWMGISARRPFPRLAGRSARQQIRRQARGRPKPETPLRETVFLMLDAFNDHLSPEIGLAAYHVLVAAGCEVHLLPGAGRTLISKGFLDEARQQARTVMDEIYQIDPEGKACIVGIEPSEIYSLQDEYPALLAGDERAGLAAKRAWMVDEYLVRPGEDGTARIMRIANLFIAKTKSVLLHGHCYQKAQPPADDRFPVGSQASKRMLEIAGYTVEETPSGCCGMAGAFGYETEHIELSLKISEMSLLPAVRAAAGTTLIAASGTSCQTQIKDGTGRTAYHPIQLISMLLID
jgi:FAD/FMN-containing dehydrogenase/Fe-S oxidoreductase